MAESPIPCGAPLIQTECERPLYHEGAHGAKLQLPPDIAVLLEKEFASLEREQRRARRWRIWFAALSLIQAVLVIQSLLEGVAL